MKKYMFDTCIFNAVLDEKIDIESLKSIKNNIFVTHIQYDEINKTPDDERRRALRKTFQQIVDTEITTESFVLDHSRLGMAKLGGDKVIPTESTVWDISCWDSGKWTPDDNLYEPLKEELDKMNNRKKSNTQDALIAETAIKNGLVLITHDHHLFTVANQFGCTVANLKTILC